MQRLGFLGPFPVRGHLTKSSRGSQCKEPAQVAHHAAYCLLPLTLLGLGPRTSGSLVECIPVIQEEQELGALYKQSEVMVSNGTNMPTPCGSPSQANDMAEYLLAMFADADVAPPCAPSRPAFSRMNRDQTARRECAGSVVADRIDP